MNEEIMKIIDSISSPENMTKREALDFLEDIQSDLESRIDALKCEIEGG